ncbi:MAG: mercuric reductase [Planctomycetaceae bacterium]
MSSTSSPLVLPDDEHNRALVANVHPPDWNNPTPAGRYNLVVIGAGPAGLITAIGAAGLGARVALVERHLMGGDCLNVGCVPSKALLRAARAVAELRVAGGFGVDPPATVRGDFPAVMARLRLLRARISGNDSATRYAREGVDVFLGAARFSGRGAVQVGDTTLRYQTAVVATGARAAKPDVPGLAEAGFLTNETVFSLTKLPARLAVIGAGPVGCELGQAFARLGAAVTLLGSAPRVLPREDADAALCVERSLERDGVVLHLGSRIVGAERCGADKVLHVERAGQRHELAVDEIIAGAGRAPVVEDLGLESVGVEFDAREGIHVDDHLRTTSPRIYAAGDVCSAYRYTHAADAMARIVIQNALFLGRARASALVIPRCTYTDPEVAHVGLTEQEAHERGIAVTTYTHKLDEVDRAILDDQTDGFVKIHVRARTDRIVGATIVATHAGEMISEITLALAAGLGLKAVSRTIHPYPTQAEAIRRAADAWNHSRLTPFIKSLVARWLAWRRRS